MNSHKSEKAIVLARGLGTRMRKQDESAALEPEQAKVALSGLKAMMPMGEYRFLDYVLTGLADAGFRKICLVIGPEHQFVRDYYTKIFPPRRFQIYFAIQEKPLGTADAVAGAEEFVGGDHFLMINSDNYYPPSVCEALRKLGRAGLALFERESLIRESNIPAERVHKYAVTWISSDGYLERIVEKPDNITLQSVQKPIYVSMNCWLFSPLIFRACRSIQPSPRGELELADAVQLAIDAWDEHFKVLKVQAGVLDLSNRADIAFVVERLRQMRVDV